MKTVDLKKYSNALENVRREAAILYRLKHPNIVKYFGHRHTTDFYYIFLEYASGGELFDQIGKFIISYFKLKLFLFFIC